MDTTFINTEKIWTYVLTGAGASIDIVANLGLKKLSIKGKAGIGSWIGKQTINNGAYASIAQLIDTGEVITLQSSEGCVLDGFTISAGAGITIYLVGTI